MWRLVPSLVAEMGAAYPELLRQLALGRQLVAGLELSGGELLADTVADLLEGARLDLGRTGHFGAGSHGQ
jgi:hypothetical protein